MIWLQGEEKAQKPGSHDMRRRAPLLDAALRHGWCI
jgi:hypothetical protein